MVEQDRHEEEISPQELLRLGREVAFRGDITEGIATHATFRGIYQDRLVAVTYASFGVAESIGVVSSLGVQRVTGDGEMFTSTLVAFDQKSFNPRELLEGIEKYEGAWVLSAVEDITQTLHGTEGFRIYFDLKKHGVLPTEYYVEGMDQQEALQRFLRAFELSGDFGSIENLANGSTFLNQESYDDAFYGKGRK